MPKTALHKTIALTLITTTTLTGCAPSIAPLLGGVGDYEQSIIQQTQQANGGICSPGGSGTASGLIATGNAENLTEEQNTNAKLILGEVKARGYGKTEAIISIITALVESELINVDYGDDIHGVTNPDGTPTSSLGLFQQQKWWGTVEERMNPQKATGLFLDALMKIDYKNMHPGTAAQTVQGSAYPAKYATRIAEAEAIISKIGDNYEETDKKYETTLEKVTQTNSCFASNGSLGGIGSGKAGKGDDYPAELRADPASIANKFDPDLDPWGLYVGQCVSFVAWRLNLQMGWKPGQEYPFTMAKMNMAGHGNGYEWAPQLAEMGYVTDKNPKIGAVAWWDSYANEYVEAYGHVAIVEDYDLEAGTVTVSQYNAYPAYLQYSEQVFPIDKISGFIHVADIEGAEEKEESEK